MSSRLRPWKIAAPAFSLLLGGLFVAYRVGSAPRARDRAVEATPAASAPAASAPAAATLPAALVPPAPAPAEETFFAGSKSAPMIGPREKTPPPPAR